MIYLPVRETRKDMSILGLVHIIHTHKLEIPLSRIYFHGSKVVHVIEVLLYFDCICRSLANILSVSLFIDQIKGCSASLCFPYYI